MFSLGLCPLSACMEQKRTGLRLQNVCFYSDDNIATVQKSEYVKVPIKKNNLSISDRCVFQKYSVSIYFGQEKNSCVFSNKGCIPKPLFFFLFYFLKALTLFFFTGNISIFLIDPRCALFFSFWRKISKQLSQNVLFSESL